MSKLWQILTPSSHPKFHQSSDRPLILRYFIPNTSFHLSLFIIDGKSEKECKVRGLKSSEEARFVSCCNGLVLLAWNGVNHYICTQYGVYNPLSRGKITTLGTPTIWRSQSCGFYFHPLAKEYRILTMAKSDKPNYEYHLYSFAAKEWRRIANPYFHCFPRCYSKRDQDRVDGNPVMVNGALHWYNGKIMVFDIISGEFSFRRLPLEKYLKQEVYSNGYLLTKEDRLCFCAVGREEPIIDIWILEDYADWSSWTKKYVVNLEWDVNEYPMTEPFARADIFNVVRVVSIYKEELVLFWRYRGVFFYHLDFHTVEKISMRKLEYPNYLDQRYYDYHCGFAAYTATTSDQ